MSETDALSSLLRNFKLNAHVFLHARFCGNWAVDTSGSRKASFHMVSRGSAWLHLPDQEYAIPLRAEDLVIFPHDAPHAISNDEKAPSPEQPRNQPAGADDKGSSTSLICGYFEFEQHNWNPLLSSLPDALVIKGEAAANTALMDMLLRFIIYETEAENPGGDVVIDKLSEVLFVHAIRTHMQTQSSTEGYLAALADKQLSRAMLQIHTKQEHPWTVEALAAEAGMSRSAFSKKFHQLVSLAPMQYLTCWRMQHAHELFANSKLSVGEVAERSAYQTEASFSKAFKKHFGYGPGAARRLHDNGDTAQKGTD